MSNKPKLYKDWYVFPNTTLTNINLDDCNDTIRGVCLQTENLAQCIDICQNDQQNLCDQGYFIQAFDRNYCLPLRNYLVGKTYPYYRLRNKNIYPQLKNLSSTVFVNKKYSFPPNNANAIFYGDNFVLRNIGSDKIVGVSSSNIIGSEVVFSKDYPLFLQFLPLQITRSDVENYVLVLNNDNVSINIPRTSFLLRPKNESVQWTTRASTVNTKNNTFIITSPGKNNSSPLNYGDKFFFSAQNGLLSYDNDSERFVFVNRPYSDTLDTDNVLFELLPKVEVYYCQNGECKKVSLQETVMNGEKAMYADRPVYRNPNCWELCHETKKFWKRSKLWILLLFFSIVLICFGIFVYFRNEF
jgi:hypothetical protein